MQLSLSDRHTIEQRMYYNNVSGKICLVWGKEAMPDYVDTIKKIAGEHIVSFSDTDKFVDWPLVWKKLP